MPKHVRWCGSQENISDIRKLSNVFCLSVLKEVVSGEIPVLCVAMTGVLRVCFMGSGAFTSVYNRFCLSFAAKPASATGRRVRP